MMHLTVKSIQAHFSFDIGCRLAKVDCKLITPDTDGTIDVEELKREISVRYFIADVLFHNPLFI